MPFKATFTTAGNKTLAGYVVLENDGEHHLADIVGLTLESRVPSVAVTDFLMSSSDVNASDFVSIIKKAKSSGESVLPADDPKSHRFGVVVWDEKHESDYKYYTCRVSDWKKEATEEQRAFLTEFRGMAS